MDIQTIRKDPDLVKESLRRRGLPTDIIDQVVQADEAWRRARNNLDNLNQKYNSLSKKVNEHRKLGQDATLIIQNVKTVRGTIETSRQEDELANHHRKKLLDQIPNLVHQSVPVSIHSKESPVISIFGHPTPRIADPGFSLLSRLAGVVDATEIAPKSFFLVGPGFHLSNAIQQFALQLLFTKGFSICSSPTFFRTQVLQRSCFPLENRRKWVFSDSTGDKTQHLICDAMEPLVSFYRDFHFTEKCLPKKNACISTCFACPDSEKKTTPELFPPQNTFTQQISLSAMILCHADQSLEFLNELVSLMTDFYTALGLPHRVVQVVSGHLDFHSALQYQFQVWNPFLGIYEEFGSCSYYSDYFSRPSLLKLGSRGPDQQIQFVHTVGSIFPQPEKILRAILQNFFREDGIEVPKVLLPFLESFLGSEGLVDGMIKFPKQEI